MMQFLQLRVFQPSVTINLVEYISPRDRKRMASSTVTAVFLGIVDREIQFFSDTMKPGKLDLAYN